MHNFFFTQVGTPLEHTKNNKSKFKDTFTTDVLRNTMFKKVAILIASLATIHAHAANLHSSALRGQGDSGPTSPGKTFDFNDEKVIRASHQDTPFLSNINLPQEEGVDVTNIDPNTDNMVAPKNECNVCQKFFNQIVFPKLAIGTPACQPKHMKALPKSGDGPALMGYCQLYNEKLHDDNRGGLELMIKDMVEQHGADLGKCAAPLAFDSCVDLGKCTETPCDICQDKVHRAFYPISPPNRPLLILTSARPI